MNDTTICGGVLGIVSPETPILTFDEGFFRNLLFVHTILLNDFRITLLRTDQSVLLHHCSFRANTILQVMWFAQSCEIHKEGTIQVM